MTARTRLIEPINPNLQPVTLAEAKAQCRVDCTDEDALITSYIATATAHAADKVGRALVPARYRLALDAFEPVIELLPPVTSVQSVTYTDAAGAIQTLPSTAWLLDTISEPGRLLPAPGTTWPATMADQPNAVIVDFTAGYAGAAVPAPVKQWILLCVGDLYDQRSRSAEKPAVPQHFADALLDAARIWTV